MKLGLNLWIWDAPFRTDRHLALIPLVRALGGEVVEFALEDDSVVDEQLLRRTLADEGLACSVVGLFGPDRDLSEDSAAARQNGLAYARRCIDVCAGVGATLFSGAVAGCGGKELLAPDVRRGQRPREREAVSGEAVHLPVARNERAASGRHRVFFSCLPASARTADDIAIRPSPL